MSGEEITKMEDSSTPVVIEYSYALICVNAGLAFLAGLICVVDLVKAE